MKTLLRSKLVIATAVVTTLGAITFACKDFLDQPAQGTVDEATLATKTGVEGSLIAAYRALDCSSSSGSWGCAASNWVWGSVPSGDAYKGSNLGDQQPINDIETYLWNVGEADDYINQKWAQVYEGVARSNATIRLLDKILAEKPSELDSATAAGIRGEAIFLRAHYHFEAYRMWGSNTDGGVGGIPYYRETDLDYRKTNVGTDALAEIEADLNTAIGLLDPSGNPRGGDAGRVTIWTAKAYKGKVQAYAAGLNPARWADVKTTLDEVVNSNHYALEPSFDLVNTARVRNGPETILAYQASVRDGEPNGYNANWGERLNFPHSGSHFGCCGFHQASFNLVNFYQTDAAGLPLAMTDTMWNHPVAQSTAQMPLSDTALANPWRGLNFWAGNPRVVDPRVDWTVGRDQVPFKDWGLHNRSWIRDASYSGPYSGKKTIHEQSTAATSESNVGWQSTQLNNVNVHILRYADVLLLLAEAEVEVGTLARATQLVNMVRARASARVQGCGTTTDSATLANYPACGTTAAIQPMAIPMDVASATLDTLTVPWARYRIGLYPTFPDQATARKAVRTERRLELALEGQHFFDLRRWGVADSAITNYVAVEKQYIPYLSLAQAFTVPKYKRYPIPTVQIELSRVGTEDRLQQNPNW